MSDEETAILRARLALSPRQVEALEQEIAELKQEHGVLSGQLHEINAVLAMEWDAGEAYEDFVSAWLERIRNILEPRS